MIETVTLTDGSESYNVITLLADSRRVRFHCADMAAAVELDRAIHHNHNTVDACLLDDDAPRLWEALRELLKATEQASECAPKDGCDPGCECGPYARARVAIASVPMERR